MKLLNGLIFFNAIVSGTERFSGTKRFCDISELTLPINAEKWNCAGESNGNLAEAGNKCSLKCDAGYSQTKYTRRSEHACKANGWRKPDQVDVQCKRDVNEVAEKADEAITSLVNNKLLKSCTFHGETSAWMPFYDQMSDRNTGTIHVTVDMSSFGLTKVNRINTWLSCSTRCWTSTGAQNVYLRPGKPDQFEIFLYQHNERTSITVDAANHWNYVLHYEVEGSC